MSLYEGKGGSILLVHYSMMVLKPAIWIVMAVVRYNHTRVAIVIRVNKIGHRIVIYR